MRRSSFLILAFTGVSTGFCRETSADLISIEPDAFAEGADLSSAFPGITLSVTGKPGSTVRAVAGYSGFNGQNIATTGSLVFGQDPIHSVNVPPGWDEFNGLLRVDFQTPTDTVEIDMIFDDDDVGILRAFNISGDLLEEFRTDLLENTFVPVAIKRPTADISFVVAGGIEGEAIFLDNMRFAMVPLNFVRGDGNADGQLDVSDAVFILIRLFQGPRSATCLDAHDVNDDGLIDISDPINILEHLFLMSPPFPLPFPGCGTDLSGDELWCELYPPCFPKVFK